MPFKFAFKKTRQYNILSKNQYVICVELLNSTSIECTLNISSIGQECLSNITARLGLRQSELFGLCYVCRHGTPSPRWVDLDKPLKKQLEKDAEGFNLYLRVMFYISDVQFIQDEMTRYHYYLQLKSDILEDRIQCSTQQAIVLASYSMQAEFGNYDSERHRIESLQQNTFFPKPIIQSELGGQIALLISSLEHYKILVGINTSAAEEYYITMVTQLEGYGYETFSAKDERSTEVVIGISINGIMVCYPTTQVTQCYRWNDISNVINHKKTFRIECQTESEYAKQFTFTESRTAKYLWRLCIAQHTFYMKLQQTSLNASEQQLTNGYFLENENSHDVSEQTSSVNLDGSGGGDDFTHWTSYNDVSSSPCPSYPVHPDRSNLRAFLPSYRAAPDYETAVQMKYSNNYYANQSDLCLMGNVPNQNIY